MDEYIEYSQLRSNDDGIKLGFGIKIVEKNRIIEKLDQENYSALIIVVTLRTYIIYFVYRRACVDNYRVFDKYKYFVVIKRII